MKKYRKLIILAIILIAVAFFSFKLITIAEAACTGCGDGGHGTCIDKPGHDS